LIGYGLYLFKKKRNEKEKANMKKLSAALAVYNEGRYLEKCLASLVDIVDEIVIVDGGSTDASLSIAKKYGARIILTDNPLNFHINKKKAVDACLGEWILQIDGDEEVSRPLALEIREVVDDSPEEREKRKIAPANLKLFLRHQTLVESRDHINRPTTGDIHGYYLPRRNFFLGKAMTYAGMYPDGVIRLFQKKYATVPAQSVHEQLVVEGRVSWLNHDLLHYSNPTLSRYMTGAAKYTDLLAKEIRHEKRNEAEKFLRYCIMQPIKTFFSLLFLHKGILDGPHGILFSLFSSLHYPVAFWKSLKSV
jgi:glycosyltransferase involved in cell wall biosynthesis